MFSISPLTIFLFAFSLILVRIFRGRSAGVIGKSAIALAVVSIIINILFVWLWARKDVLPSKFIGLSVLGLYISVLMVFAAVMLTKKLDETRRFQYVAGIWLLLFFLLMKGFHRDYLENIWFLDVMNNLLQSVTGDNHISETTLLLIDAFGKTNLYIARRFLELTTAGTLALAYLFYIFVGAYYGREKYLHWRGIQTPRVFALIAGAVFLFCGAWRLFTREPTEPEFLKISAHIIVGVYFLTGSLLLLKGVVAGKFTRKAAFFSVLIGVFSGHTMEVAALIGFVHNLAGMSCLNEETRIMKSPFPRAVMQKLASIKSFAAMLAASVVFIFLFSTRANRPSDNPGAWPSAAEIEEPGMKGIESKTHAFYMDVYEFPNIEGEPPVRGVSFDEAGRACGRIGKRLCTADEWEAVCRGPKRRMYEFADDGNESHGILNKRCNTLPMGVRRKGVAKSGSMDCVNELGIRDMTGNVWEWVDGDSGGPFRLLKGSSYQYNDDYTTLCATKILLLDVQISNLTLPTAGFRCCKDAN